MKITKREFITAMTENLTVFLGVTRKFYSADELECMLSDYLNKSNDLYNMRSCEKRSDKRLVFSGGSELRFDQIGKYEFFKYELSGSCRKINLYICRHTNGNYQNCMHYSVEEK